MEAIILAAGKGNRLRDVTGGKPKCYVELAGESLLDRNLRLLRESGVSRIILVTGYQRQRFLRDYTAPDIEIAFNPFFEQANVLSSFWTGMYRLQDDFLYLHADTVFDGKVLAELVQTGGEFVLACDAKECAEEEMKYRLEGDRVIEINKTMDPAASEGEFLGLCKVSGTCLPPLRGAVEDVLERGEFGAFFEMAIQELIDRDAVPVTVMSTGALPWMEIDFPEDYEMAKNLFES